jgi:hypothetical protein
VKLYVAVFAVSQSVKLIVQLHDTLSFHAVGLIVNWFPFNVHVALELLVTLGVIVSQPHALTHKSVITLVIVLFPVNTHKLLLVVFTTNGASVHSYNTFCSV